MKIDANNGHQIGRIGPHPTHQTNKQIQNLIVLFFSLFSFFVCSFVCLFVRSFVRLEIVGLHRDQLINDECP